LGNPISWASKLQKTVALSSCEAEYMALKEATKEMLYLKEIAINLLSKLTKHNIVTNTIYTDSKSAIDLAKNPEHHARSKHIDIQYHFVRENVQNGIIKLEYISTKEQLADILTKGLVNTAYRYLVRKLSLKRFTKEEILLEI
jgi:hypothetical protein